ncbi:MAG: hypothetical protein JXL97_11030 [Bacteroidales bacterium]|nr:hypothetical protein [Bacteroidales bacterium]
MKNKLNVIIPAKQENILSNLSTFFDEIDNNQMNLINGGTAVPVNCRRGYSTYDDDGYTGMSCKCGYSD